MASTSSRSARSRLRSAAEQVNQARRLIPVALVPAIARRRAEKLWQDEGFRRSQEAEMEHLVGRSERAAEVPQLARAYTEQMLIRSHMRWHPRVITRQRVRGIELITGRDQSRGAIVSFMHHHRYEGMVGSLVHAGGPPMKIVITEAITKPEAGIGFAQHLRVASRGGEFVMAETGASALAAELQPGVVMAIAPDFAGRTPVTFLGRTVLAPFGTPRIAMLTDSPILPVTHRRDADGPYVQVEQPIDPRDFERPEDLLVAVLDAHARAILDWPEAVDAPHSRFGLPAED